MSNLIGPSPTELFLEISRRSEGLLDRASRGALSSMDQVLLREAADYLVDIIAENTRAKASL